MSSKPFMIGIFGDSFASTHTESNHFAWYNLLAKKLDGTVYNFEQNQEHVSYGSGASTTFYNYKKFKKYHKRHQLNIMVVTDSWRYPSPLNLSNFSNLFLGFNNADYYLRKEQSRLTKGDKEILEHLKSWYMINDTDYMETTQEMILQEIETLCPNVLLLPASPETFNDKRKAKSITDFSMWEYHAVQLSELGIKNKLFKSTGSLIQNEENKENIACHLSLESNEVFAELIFNYLNNKEKIKLPRSIPHKHNWDYYYNDRD